MNQNEFYFKVSKALSGCQMVEMELKLYLTNASELIRKRLGNRMPYRFDESDIQRLSLERLIKFFRKHSNNDELCARLNKFKTERNFLAHSAISECMNKHEGYQEFYASNLESRLTKIEQDAIELFYDIHKESTNFLGYLYFEDEDSVS